MQIKFFIRILLQFLVITCSLKLFATTYGSDYSTIQGQLSIAGDTDNRIANNAYIDNGFNLTDNTTTCSFDSFQSCLGVINLNQGKLYLLRDMFLSNFFSFGSGGQIYSQGHAISFPCTSNIQFPDSRVTKTLAEPSNQTLLGIVSSVSWSYDDKYVAAGASISANNLSVYGFSNNTLSAAIDSISIGYNVNSLSWSPTNNYLAVGIANTTTNITVYQWDGSTLSTVAADQKSLTTGVSAVAWSPDGKYLAVAYGTGATAAVQIYSYSGSGTLATAGSALVYGTSGVIPVNGALNWNSIGSYYYLALGYYNGSTGYTAILSFNGTTLAQVTGSPYSLGSAVTACVAYRPGGTNGINAVAVGLTSSTTRFRLYNPLSGALTQTWANTESVNYNSVCWSNDGSYLATGLSTGGTNLRIYYFPGNNSSLSLTSAAYKLSLICAKNLASNVTAVNWSNTSNNYIAAGYGLTVGVFQINQLSETRKTLYIDNTTINLNSNMELTSTITFYGNCTINGNGNNLTLNNQTGNISVAENGILNLKNISIKGLKNKNLQCLSNNASIVMTNCKLTLTSDFIFDAGSLEFNQDILVTGTNKFSYASTGTSYITPHSTLYFDANTTFSYSPRLTSRHTHSERDLIKLIDKTSSIFFNECTLQLPDSGWRVTNGTIYFNNNVKIYGQTTKENSFELGNGNIANDPDIQLLSGANIENYGYMYANLGM